jgi:hypothetical protein
MDRTLALACFLLRQDRQAAPLVRTLWVLSSPEPLADEDIGTILDVQVIMERSLREQARFKASSVA